MIRINLLLEGDPAVFLGVVNGWSEARVCAEALKKLYKSEIIIEQIKHTLQNTKCHAVNLGDYAYYPPYCEGIKNNRCCCSQCCSCGG